LGLDLLRLDLTSLVEMDARQPIPRDEVVEIKLKVRSDCIPWTIVGALSKE